MEATDVATIVRGIIEAELELSPNTMAPDVPLRETYGLDSVAAVNILFEIERQFDVELSISAIANVVSLSDVIRLVRESTVLRHPIAGN